ncbi:MAG: hypothetical protein IJT79_08920 [Ruminococcus sp.]|nr:hypothetical protein [Ruminococcus sp.]
MNKKILLCAVSVLLVMILAMSSLFMVSAAGEPVETQQVETGATFTRGETTSANTTESTEPSAPVKLVGDVDGNGTVDVNDATAYQLTLAGRQEVTAAFELNGNTVTDGKKNIIDVTGIQYYVAKVFKKLPVTLDGYYSEIIRP